MGPEASRRTEVFDSAKDAEEKARLIAALGHDIKGPLHVLRLSIHGLLLKDFDDETRTILQSAEAALDEVASLNEDLLDALRFGVGVGRGREEGITLGNLLSDLKRRFRRREQQEGVEVSVKPTKIYCVTVRHTLQRVLGNLIENAFKHSGASRIVVGARIRSVDRLVLEVVDDGHGIPPSELPFVFDEWFRGGRAVKSGVRGQGLGLWAVKRCVESLSGTVTVQSREGIGTRFTVQIPAYVERRPYICSAAFSGLGRLNGKVVAVIDDDEDVVAALEGSFESLGAKVLSASDDLHFLAQLALLPRMPDLFVLDFNLGGKTVERALRVLQSRYGASLPAVLVTGLTSDSRLDPYRIRIPVVGKPISASHFAQIVEVAAGQRHCRPEYFV